MPSCLELTINALPISFNGFDRPKYIVELQKFVLKK